MIITLTTDFGLKDYFVGAMKGVILTINPKAEIIDITHEISSQNIRSAGFNLSACYRNFPVGTIHVAVVDPEVGSGRRAILVKTDDYVFVAPDNGLLSFVFETESNFRVFEITEKKFMAEKISRTFHGRDVFAPVAGHLSKGVSPQEFGREIGDFVKFETSSAKKTSETQIVGEVIEIDRFGNIITNFTVEDLPEKFVLEINGRRVERLNSFYAESKIGESFAIFGSAERLEIVAYQDSAEKKFLAKIGDEVVLHLSK